MKKTHILSVIFLILIYSLFSVLIDRSYILPSIPLILKSLVNILLDTKFILIVFNTLIRTLLGVFLSFILALVLATASFYHKSFKEFMEPIHILLKTIPNITYIILALLWLGRNGSVILVSFLVIFPILYQSILHGFEHIDDSLLNITMTYENGYFLKYKRIFLPLISKDIYLALKNSLSLAFKVSIMAEILGQVDIGIGKAMHFAKINYLTEDIFAWTIIVIIISALIDKAFDYIIKKSI